MLWGDYGIHRETTRRLKIQATTTIMADYRFFRRPIQYVSIVLTTLSICLFMAEETTIPKKPKIKRQTNEEQAKIVHDGILAFMKNCKRNSEYHIHSARANTLSFTSNEIYMWNRKDEKLDLVGIYSYTLEKKLDYEDTEYMNKFNEHKIINAVIHLGKKVPVFIPGH